MRQITYHSTNNRREHVNFETALLRGISRDYGLYTIERRDIPKLSREQIRQMRGKSYAEIAFDVLNPFLGYEIPDDKLRPLLDDAYSEEKIPTKVQREACQGVNILWLTNGPTYSFKDYAARFFVRALDYFLGERGKRRTVIVATSGDTGGAVADALYGLNNVDNVVFFPKGSISEGQRRQMTTLGGNVYAFEVNGNFDVCQDMAVRLLGGTQFAMDTFGDAERLTSANSISIGRLLPQTVYPFFAYSRIDGKKMIASIPSGNFGDMMGTVIAKEMGLPVSRIICGVNENTEFPEFLETGRFTVRNQKNSPSSAMNVSNPKNLTRLVYFYGGHMYDERDEAGRVVRPSVIDKMPNMNNMNKDIFSVGVPNDEHYATMNRVFAMQGIVLDPHGAVGWSALERYYDLFDGKEPAVVYETADPGKFPDDVERAIGRKPDVPIGMQKQAALQERIYTIENKPDNIKGRLTLSDAQLEEAKEKIRSLF